MAYYPGEANFRAADVIVVNKVNTATAEAVESVVSNARSANPKAQVVKAVSEVTTDDPAALKGKKVLVIEDGPTLTHGEMGYGAGRVAAEKFGARGRRPPALRRRQHPRPVHQVPAPQGHCPGHGLLPGAGQRAGRHHQPDGV